MAPGQPIKTMTKVVGDGMIHNINQATNSDGKIANFYKDLISTKSG